VNVECEPYSTFDVAVVLLSHHAPYKQHERAVDRKEYAEVRVILNRDGASIQQLQFAQFTGDRAAFVRADFRDFMALLVGNVLWLIDNVLAFDWPMPHYFRLMNIYDTCCINLN
jgi:hypothetical protein